MRAPPPNISRVTAKVDTGLKNPVLRKMSIDNKNASSRDTSRIEPRGNLTFNGKSGKQNQEDEKKKLPRWK